MFLLVFKNVFRAIEISGSKDLLMKLQGDITLHMKIQTTAMLLMVSAICCAGCETLET